MRYPEAETREKHERILKQASTLFRERGFSGVSVAEIMKGAGLTHGPFYNHFSSKEDLMAAGIERAMMDAVAMLKAGRNSPTAKAEYLKNYLNLAHRDAPGKGCPIAALASDVSREPAVRGVFTAQVKAFVETFSSRFRWRSKRTARAESIRFLASIVGALILARAVDDSEFSDEILREVRRELQSTPTDRRAASTAP
jgi:TetR/AcrR family transcriptional repressor of nem operon